MEYSATESKAYKQASVGTHTGICYMVCTIGTQTVSFPGDEDKQVSQVIVGWELPEELTDDGKPLSVIKTYTLSFNEKASLAKDYKAWTKEASPKTFKLDSLIGKGCNLNIGETSGGKAKVTGVSALKASETVPALSRDSILFDIRKPNMTELGKLPDFIKTKIIESPEYIAWEQKHLANEGAGSELNDEIPF